jgi:hypothetical protein
VAGHNEDSFLHYQILQLKTTIMKRIKKCVLAMVAVFALSAAPQSASAKVHRVFYAVDQDFYMQFAYDDVSGVFAIRLMDWDGECYGEWYV